MHVSGKKKEFKDIYFIHSSCKNNELAYKKCSFNQSTNNNMSNCGIFKPKEYKERHVKIGKYMKVISVFKHTAG